MTMKRPTPDVEDVQSGQATAAPEQWRSLGQLAQTPAYRAAVDNEFLAEDPTELEVHHRVGRRKFLGLMGATSALAGVSLSGCIRKPKEQILPYAKRPEDLIPGKPRFFATSASIAGTTLGLLVESQDGRPTKVEGNPLHPASLGATSALAQAEVLDLYDPERTRKPLKKGKKGTWVAFLGQLDGRLKGAAKNGGQGLALLVEDNTSPTFRWLLKRFSKRFPLAKVYVDDAAGRPNTLAGLALAGLTDVRPHFDLTRARTIVALDSDLLGFGHDAVRHAREFANARRVTSPDDPMNRLYVVESYFTATGTVADHRLQLSSGQVGDFLAALFAALVKQGLKVPETAAGLKAGGGGFGKWPGAVAKDLLKHRGKSLVVVGERQPAEVHALATLINVALENLGSTLSLTDDADAPQAGDLNALAHALKKGQVSTLVALGGNPVYTAPVELKIGELIKKIDLFIHSGSHKNETAALADWHIPRSHWLEAWGDTRAGDGTVGIAQPLIAPLFDSRSDIEILARLAGLEQRRGYALVRARAEAALGKPADFDASWKRWLHDGVARSWPKEPPAQNVSWAKLATAFAARKRAKTPGKEALEVNFRLCSKLFDGRYANNGWLQELPDPVTKLTWDNAACLSPKTAKALGLDSGEMVELSLGGRKLSLPAFVAPGTADNTVTVALGYGRKVVGEVGKKAGFNAYLLRGSSAPHFASGGSIKRVGKRRYILASTQDHGSLEGRPLVRIGTREQYRKDPEFAKKPDIHPPLKSIWKEPNETKGQQWGMSIDLSACNGCNACVMACQAENNVPVVGKRRCNEGREMHWIRIDRYFAGSPDDPEMLVQPMSCHHCELAPCESVCPVAATVHSPEGLNDMAYNRCIGTRYCSNNCPYKVRRFNFFQYNGDLDPIAQMQKNPDVTVRFRGVMEKCTFCVQRITEAKIKAKRQGDGTVPDGGAVPACQQACPTKAIVFGDINDKKSQVAKLKAQTRDYTVLGELNNKPRTTYLAKLRNPNPELV